MRTPEVGEELVNPVSGTRMLFRATAASTDGDHVEVDATYPPHSAPPPRHLHPAQAERFTVLAGLLSTVVDGVPRVLGVGEVLDVAAGVVHTMSGAADTETVVRWRTTPALRTDSLHCELWQAAADADWRPDPMALFAVVQRYPDEFRFA